MVYWEYVRACNQSAGLSRGPLRQTGVRYSESCPGCRARDEANGQTALAVKILRFEWREKANFHLPFASNASRTNFAVCDYQRLTACDWCEAGRSGYICSIFGTCPFGECGLIQC